MRLGGGGGGYGARPELNGLKPEIKPVEERELLECTDR